VTDLLGQSVALSLQRLLLGLLLTPFRLQPHESVNVEHEATTQKCLRDSVGIISQ
jgi:hypothetical protein